MERMKSESKNKVRSSVDDSNDSDEGAADVPMEPTETVSMESVGPCKTYTSESLVLVSMIS